MSGELLAVLDHLERDKGISRAVLLEAVKTALVSAARKTLNLHEEDQEADISVDIDQITGEITIIANGKKLPTAQCGRIAAQTARQVMIQKIREAERDVVYDEFSGKIGQLVNGVIQRFDRGDIVVDLGRTEALLPRREQSEKEEHRLGDRLRACVISVEKTSKGTEILLSRSSATLLQKLLELEVPEIYEGIVEVKGIAREAGDRSKVAVSSKDDRVDAVGACVGMRGNRIKNIVRELRGEKIDIVRWNFNMEDFIRESLGPAQVLQIVLFQDIQQAEVIVADDQLSLAIGKRGQNVRLASKLTGYTLDIRTPAQVAARRELKLDALEGITPEIVECLTAGGIESVEALVRTPEERLLMVEGITVETSNALILAARMAVSKAEEAAAARQRSSLAETLGGKKAEGSEQAAATAEKVMSASEALFAPNGAAAQAPEPAGESAEESEEGAAEGIAEESAEGAVESGAEQAEEPSQEEQPKEERAE